MHSPARLPESMHWDNIVIMFQPLIRQLYIYTYTYRLHFVMLFFIYLVLLCIKFIFLSLSYSVYNNTVIDLCKINSVGGTVLGRTVHCEKQNQNK